jgi:transcription-repair coupling factor (superfamily II helicase)
LNEAIQELKENEFKDLYEDTTAAEDKVFVKDTQIDTDFELLFPDDYINNISERLSLYTKLNNLKTEEELQKFEADLEDRFGELPTQAIDLLNSVRIKWIASHIGLEKVIMKQGKLIGYFIADQQSKFYQTPIFTKVLQYVQSHSHSSTMKEKKTRAGLRLLLTFEKISSIERALKVLEPLDFRVKVEEEVKV